MAKRSHYEILGVTPLVSADDLKKAFRKLSMENHPDTHPGDKEAEERMKDINVAYGVLSDPLQRTLYDAAQSQRDHDPFQDFWKTTANYQGEYTWQAGSAPRIRAVKSDGEDIEVGLVISLREAFTGCEKEGTIPRFTACQACNNTGDSRDVVVCERCLGTGTQSTVGSATVTHRRCNGCFGTGSTGPACPVCLGKSRRPQQDTLTIRIPAGVADGGVVIARGAGNAGTRGGKPGDLLVRVKVVDVPGFRRVGLDLHSEVTVDFLTALRGGPVSVKNLIDAERLVIAPCTQPESECRLPNQGFKMQGKVGDHVVTVHVRFPTTMTKRQEKLLDRWDQAE